jgi:multiple sugar transport system substrate-binding protein
MRSRSFGIVRLSSIFALAGLALLALGCSRTRPATIRLVGDKWFLNSLINARKIASFEQQTGIHVAVVYKDDTAIMKDLDLGPKRTNGGYDVLVMRHRWLGTLVQKGQIRPIDSFISDSALQSTNFNPDQQLFTNWLRELSSYGKKTYGYPFTCLTTYLCYRKDMLADPANRREFRLRYHRELEPPTTWQEYTELAQFFTRPHEHLFGTYIQGKQGLALWYEWLNFIYSFGGNILDTSHGWQYGDIVVNSPQNVAATTQYVKLIAFSPPDTLSYGWNEAFSALQEGRAFMGLLWSDQAPDLEKPGSKVAGKIGYSLIPSEIPQPFSQLEGLTYLIPTQSKHTAEAYRFIEWAMSSPIQIEQTLHGSESARKSTYDDSAVMAIPYTPTFLASVPVAVPKPTIPEANRMTEAMERRVFEIVSGKSSPKGGLDNLALDIQGILGNKSRLRYPVKSARQQ